MSKITINISGDEVQITGSASLKEITQMGKAFVRCMIEVTQEYDAVLSTIRQQSATSRETNLMELGIYIEE